MSNKGIKNSLKSLSLPADWRPGVPCVSNSLEDEDIDSQRPEPQFAGAARYRGLRHRTSETFFGELEALYPAVGFGYFQSNLEGELIDAVQQADVTYDGVVLKPADIPIRRWRCASGVGGVGARSSRCTLVDPRARGVPPRLAPGSRGRGLDHGFRAGFLPAGRRGPVAPRQGVSPGFPERPIPRPGRGGSACGRPLPGCSRGACAGAGTGRNVKCRNTNILASYFYV